MFYFKFQIPNMTNGDVVRYSQGWCGTRDKCAQNEKGIYYNDKERWGIGIAEGSFVPPDVEVVDAKKALELMGVAAPVTTQVSKSAVLEMSELGVVKADGVEITLPDEATLEAEVFLGKKLMDRWTAKPFSPTIPFDIKPGDVEKVLDG
jgi:hypothetical protein